MSIPKVFVRTPYNYDRDAVSAETGLCCPEPSLTVQDPGIDLDPNSIVDKARRGVDISLSLSTREPQYGDFTDFTKSRHDLMNEIAQANSTFFSLPETTRKLFNHDPVAFRRWAAAPENIPGLVQLGLLKADAVPYEPLAPAPAPAPAGGVEEGA